MLSNSNLPDGIRSTIGTPRYTLSKILPITMAASQSHRQATSRDRWLVLDFAASSIALRMKKYSTYNTALRPVSDFDARLTFLPILG